MDSPSNMSQDGDRISALPDHILLQILEPLGLRTAIRAGVLSTRWRHLPHELRYLLLNVSNFRGASRTSLGMIMKTYTDTLRRLLSTPACGCSRPIRSLRLSFYLADPYLCPIGHAVGDVVKSGGTDFLEFMIYPPVPRPSRTQLALFGRQFMSFFRACPTAFRCLTRLTVEDLTFQDSDVPDLLNTCSKLRFLSFTSCELAQEDSVLCIDALSSELRELELTSFKCKRIELTCVPELRQVLCSNWYKENPPLRFGHVPRLQKISLASSALSRQKPFTLSKCLFGTMDLLVLELNFRTQMIWIKPEDPKQLAPIFTNMKTVCLYNIFAECDLNWTLLILEAAPSLKNFCLSRHTCELNSEEHSAEKMNVVWETSTFKHLNLKLLLLKGFEEEQMVMSYIRLVMERAVSLTRIELRDKDPCKVCNLVSPRFPVDEVSRHRIRERLAYGFSSSAEIIIS